jgi:hypothetical protein
MKKIVILVLLIVNATVLYSQKIDTMASFRDISSDCYFRFSLDDDYFASSDQNYTGGYDFEIVDPVLRKNPITSLFLKPKNSIYKYGLSFEQIVFTPDCISSPEVQIGDRPYAVAIMLKSSIIAIDTIHKSRLNSSLNLGLIGPGAFGKEIQTNIHRVTGNTIPHGWCHQIQNDIVLNYEISYERQLIRYTNLFSLQASSTVRLGTLFTNASVGLNATVGLINSPFSSIHRKHKFQIYVYSQLVGSVIGYDATLQGGVFDRNSCYTISNSEIERFTAQHNFGIVLQKNSCYLEYSMTGITREFETGDSANWGSIKFGITL